jgi:SMI1 / KNR4 family (SUKH-1)
MTDLIEKYFSDIPIKGDYAEKNIFFPPAAQEEIWKTENALSIKFPPDYIDFILTTNGFDGKLGKSYSRFIQLGKIIEYTRMYAGAFFPWAVYIGDDGGNEMYVFDGRQDKLRFGLLPFIGEENEFISLGKTFEEFVKHLYDQDFWRK